MENCKSIEDGVEVCARCHGQGRLISDSIALYSLCESCGGDGHILWIENAIGNKEPKHGNAERIYHIQKDNLRRLENLLHLYASKMGLLVRVEYDSTLNPLHRDIHF